MPWGLKRLHETRQIHFLTFSCYHRQPKFTDATAYDTFVEALERIRANYSLCVYGYVVMPEHVHLLVSEPERNNALPSHQVSEARRRKKASAASRRFDLAGTVLRLQHLEREEVCGETALHSSKSGEAWIG
jgi:REP element-mobilizing transposase RayT